MARYEFEPPNCWIKGDMGSSDLEGDAVRQATQNCKYRKARPSHSIFGGNDHVCVHPAALGEHEETQILPGGGVQAGGVDGFAIFCEPVDMHLTSLGEKSRFIIEGEFRDVTDETVKPQLPEPRKGILGRLLRSNNS